MRAAGPPPRGSSRLSSCTGRIDRERSHGLTRIRRRVRTVRRARVSGALPRARVESFSRAARRRSRNNTDPLEFGWSSPLGRRRDRRALSVPSPSTCARQSGNLGSASNTPCTIVCIGYRPAPVESRVSGSVGERSARRHSQRSEAQREEAAAWATLGGGRNPRCPGPSHAQNPLPPLVLPCVGKGAIKDRGAESAELELAPSRDAKDPRGGHEHAGGRVMRGRGVVGVLSSRSRRCFSLVLVLPWVPEGECGIILVLCWLVVD